MKKTWGIRSDKDEQEWWLSSFEGSDGTPAIAWTLEPMTDRLVVYDTEMEATLVAVGIRALVRQDEGLTDVDFWVEEIDRPDPAG